MNRRALLPVALAAVGTIGVLIGIYTELLHFTQPADATIQTGWGGDLNHEERLLAQLGGLAVVGAIAAVRWRAASVVPAAVGGVVLFYAARAVLHYLPGVLTGVRMPDGTTGRIAFGAEPYLLLVAGLLFVGAGVVGWRSGGPVTDRESTPLESIAS